MLDWKTDRLDAAALPSRVEIYRPQMEIYRDAVAEMWGRPVEAWIVFMRTGEAVRVEDLTPRPPHV